jgi:TPR repeat protein
MDYRIKGTFWMSVLVAAMLAVAGCSDKSKVDAASYQQGIDAYAKGDMAAALEKLKPHAEQGNAEAQFRLGLIYREGKGVAQDDKQATDWLNKAAEQGHVEAQENLGLSYAKGLGVEPDWVQADKWFGIAAASGKESAIKNQQVVEVHMQPENIAEANKLAQEWLAKHKK